MALVTASQFDFGPNFLQASRQGAQLAGQLTQNEANRLALEQAQGQAERGTQVRQLLGQAGQQQPQTQQQQMLAEQTVGFGGEQALSEQPQAVRSQDELIQLARQVDPVQAEESLKKMGLDSASKRAEMSRFAAKLQATPPQLRADAINARAQSLQGQGRDPSETLKLLNLSPQEQEQALTGIQLFDLSTKERFGVQAAQARQRQATQKSFAPVTIVNAAGEKRLVSPTVDNLTGAAKLNPFDIPEGFSLSKETDAEARAADVISKSQEESAKVTAKSIAERRQSQIDKGLEAAEGMANIKRAQELLGAVKTGGFDNAALKAKQFFGIEGADEAELSNRLGKAVLSQLKATFGAAFTAQEGQKLAEIEAGFGKSTQGNKRLLNQAEKIVLRAAKRGMRAARAQGDLDTVKDIQESLDFRLSTEAQQGATTPPPPAGFVIEGQ